MSLVPSSLLFLVTVLDGFDDEWAIRLKITLALVKVKLLRLLVRKNKIGGKKIG